MSRNDPDQHPDDYPDEVMTGWDDPDDLERTLQTETQGAGRQLLVALNRYLTEHGPDDQLRREFTEARETLLQAMRRIDWNVMDFTQSAIDKGEEIFSCHPGNDVLLKYNPGRRRDPQQQEFAF